jgi:hypothetical protein
LKASNDAKRQSGRSETPGETAARGSRCGSLLALHIRNARAVGAIRDAPSCTIRTWGIGEPRDPGGLLALGCPPHPITSSNTTRRCRLASPRWAWAGWKPPDSDDHGKEHGWMMGFGPGALETYPRVAASLRAPFIVSESRCVSDCGLVGCLPSGIGDSKGCAGEA